MCHSELLNIALLQDDTTVPPTRKQPDMTAATVPVRTLQLP